MDNEDFRPYVYNPNCCPPQKCHPTPSCHFIIVQQIVGEGEEQKSIDLNIRVPRNKPAIEQIVDVLAKKVTITCVDVVTDKVIVRGHFEVKAMYVACRPDQPVHAIEARRVPFTIGVDICGARCGMDAEATVGIEFIDYDCDRRTRAYWHKKHENCNEKPKYKKPKRCCRTFHVSIVLCARAKVMTDRKIPVSPSPIHHFLPHKPKG